MNVIETYINEKILSAGLKSKGVISLIIKLENNQFILKLSGSDESYNSYVWCEEELNIGDKIFVRIKDTDYISSPSNIIDYNEIANATKNNETHNLHLYLQALEHILKSKGLLI